jgi:uncharacterized repeat protein (TIGR01451 family)
MKKLFTKIILALAFLGIGINHTQAQYVTIQDNNFKNWLMQQYPSCFNASQEMDTTCSNIVNETSLILPTSIQLSLFDIREIKYFDSLESLIVTFNNIQTIERFPSSLENIGFESLPMLTTIPVLPSGLDTLKLAFTNVQLIQGNFPDSLAALNLSYGQFTFLPPIPNTVKVLALNHNYQISNLQAILNNLHEGLETLGMAYTGMSYIPNLPSTLVFLNCSGNSITQIPANMPLNLNSLYISENQIFGPLLNVPPSVSILDISSNQITSIPDFNNLSFINCSNNAIDTLSLNNSNLLTTVICNNNNLAHIEGSFGYLQYMECSNNQLTSIDFVSNSLVSYLKFSNNQVSCMPELPQNLWWPSQFDATLNNFHCVQNYVAAMDSAFIANYPLCVYGDSISNPNNCRNANGIVGATYHDLNNNCVEDVNDGNLSNVKINFYNPINNDFWTVYSHYGVFNNTLPPATYWLNIDTTNASYEIDCNYPGMDTIVQLTNIQILADSVNFSLKCKSGFDIGAKSVCLNEGIAFPGQLHHTKIVAGDLSQWYNLNCAQGTGGQVTITYTGPVSFEAPDLNALTPSVSGNTLSYLVNDFGNVDIETAFNLIFRTDTTAQSGDLICISVQLTSSATETNSTNNLLNFCYPVVNSYDPNYKEVYPTNVEQGFQDWLTYTIHFQNLGDAPAFNIRILDTLDSNLDAQTFEILNASHFNTTTLQNSIINFRFPNIMLPDSASNPSGSQGFVQYRIKPLANLPVGTQIKNTAHIYFDFNPAIVTNTTENNFVTTVGNITLPQIPSIQVYPNPSSGVFMISAKANIEVYNLVGELVLTENNATSIDLTAAPKGMYFIKLNGGRIEKLIKN